MAAHRNINITKKISNPFPCFTEFSSIAIPPGAVTGRPFPAPCVQIKKILVKLNYSKVFDKNQSFFCKDTRTIARKVGSKV